MSGYLQEATSTVRNKAVTVTSLQALRNSGEKITMLTC
ncbi:MAG TPA: 3-methyl-2-oxobutanoate hydroxymethyltransferase, partial [Noviherbaspirillum sp.]|nr:3-methyl-2-oxobutanoate hydroxymethyltransferase [Noviherbaspirillum sp.]